MSTKQINFTIVPADGAMSGDRTYANFCAVAHSPFDLTITFCDVRPLTPADIAEAEHTQTVKAPVVARLALPFAVVPGLINALQEQMRAMQAAQPEGGAPPWPEQGPLH